MIENILIFIIFLCPLVFFHELGHFIFARLFGVRVEVFSLGFGPKLFRFNRGGTEYAFSLIPLGGYIKMFGDDPLNKEAVPESERQFSFSYKSKWARFWIVFGGPLANMILAFFIFWFLLLSGETLPEIKFGVVNQGSPFYEKGARSGDLLRAVNDITVVSPTDFISTGEIVKSITVEREGKTVNVPLGFDSQMFLELFSKVMPLLRIPVVTNEKGEFFSLTLDPKIPMGTKSLEELQDLVGVKDFHLYKITEGIKDFSNLKTENFSFIKQISIKITDPDSFFQALAKENLFAHDLLVKSVNMDSPADKAGLGAGDIIISLNDHEMFSFDQVRAKIQDLPTQQKIKLTVKRLGTIKSFEILPEITKQDGKEMKIIGVYSTGEFIPMKFVKTPSKGFFEAAWMGLLRTFEATAKTLDGFKKLITKEVSLKNIGGPIAIGKVASDSFKTSLSYFFQIMAFISINLGIINLFPIPVLDGGHIMFIILEIANRGPLSRRKMEIAQQFGLSMLLILTVAAIFNDISKFF
ncbi:MAG: RIP metalloprotease RseP [Bdellovibrio sp.]|nr:RIP metalloprotease RseP [Bdellovibrio sp.]